MQRRKNGAETKRKRNNDEASREKQASAISLHGQNICVKSDQEEVKYKKKCLSLYLAKTKTDYFDYGKDDSALHNTCIIWTVSGSRASCLPIAPTTHRKSKCPFCTTAMLGVALPLRTNF